MEENKNLNTAPETTEEKIKNPKKEKKPKKEKLLKNESLFKKGSYSLALTAIVLAVIIIVNVLVSVLNDRFTLEFDMTKEKQNSISPTNIEYIKAVEKDVDVVVCALESNFVSYMGATAQNSYSVDYNATAREYFDQTLNLINKYNHYNDKINVRFVDTQSSEFASITSEYGADNIEYGTIIVATEKEEGKKRIKKLNFSDIYTIEQDDSYSYYGVEVNTITGNKIETALTSAISYVLSNATAKAAILTGHSDYNITEDFVEMLEDNNYVVATFSDAVIKSIPDEYDLIVIPTPSKDFTEDEINAIAKYLDNDGNLQKGMMVFADASAPYLTNFYSFLSEWGIEIDEGMLYETDETYHAPDDPTTLFAINTGEVDDLSEYELFIGGLNIPMQVAKSTENNRSVKPIISTLDSVVEAPKTATSGWDGADDAVKSTYHFAIESSQSAYAEDNELIYSRVVAFSSPYFLESEYNDSSYVSNKEITLAVANKISAINDTGISFVSKSITVESYYDSINQSSVNTVRVLFMIILPLAVLALGIVIFIKRRNA
ncbi:MAG: Gldg family protein [Clostridia bacterium]|nr:Gldg family protein [Clostridia bacterium]